MRVDKYIWLREPAYILRHPNGVPVKPDFDIEFKDGKLQMIRLRWNPTKTVRTVYTPAQQAWAMVAMFVIVFCFGAWLGSVVF